MKKIQKTGQILLIGSGPNGLVLIGKIATDRPRPTEIVFPKPPILGVKTDIGNAPLASVDGAFLFKKRALKIREALRRSAHKDHVLRETGVGRAWLLRFS